MADAAWSLADYFSFFVYKWQPFFFFHFKPDDPVTDEQSYKIDTYEQIEQACRNEICRCFRKQEDCPVSQ